MSKEINDIRKNFTSSGEIRWIGVRPVKGAPLRSVEQVNVSPELGLDGDHYQKSSRKRQVTLLQAEHLEIVGKMLAREISPLDTRRNIVVAGINLQALKGQTFMLGDRVILKGTGDCIPCRKMEQNLGRGGYNCMLGHGGITAEVITPGRITVGDALSPIIPD